MTPRERAQQFVDTQALLSLGEMQRVNVIEALLLADRQALQAETIKRLQMERAEASPKAYLALNAAIGIVQAVFDQPAKPEGSKPEADMVHFAVVPFQAYCGADKRGQCTAAPLASVTCKDCLAKYQAESDRRALAEREVCIGFLEAQIKGFETLRKHGFYNTMTNQLSLESTIHSLRETVKQIRARSEQGSGAKKKCGKTVYGQYDKYPCALHPGHEGICKYQGEIWAEGKETERTIRRLNESNNKLSEENYALREKVQRLEQSQFGTILAASERDKQTIARLEKENHELTQKLETAPCVGRCRVMYDGTIRHADSCPASRKA